MVLEDKCRSEATADFPDLRLATECPSVMEDQSGSYAPDGKGENPEFGITYLHIYRKFILFLVIVHQ